MTMSPKPWWRMAPKALQGYAYAIKGGELSRAAYNFYFFTLWKGIDDAQSFLGCVPSTKLLFRIWFFSAARAHPTRADCDVVEKIFMIRILYRFSHYFWNTWQF